MGHTQKDIEQGDTNKAPIEDPNARPACFNSTLQEVLFVLSVTMAVAMTTFLTGSTTVIASFAGKDLHMTTAEITWMNAASGLSSGATLLFFGSIADILGRKPLFIISTLLFSIFSLAAGFAQNGITLDILSGILGICSAAAVPPAQGMLGTIYKSPSRRKNRVFGCYLAGNPLGYAAGSLFSGIATNVMSWRAAFPLLAIVYVVVTVVACFVLPDDGGMRRSVDMDMVKRLDLPGMGMAGLGIGMFCAALSLGSTAPEGWKTPFVLVLLVLGVLGMVAFVVWEIWSPYAVIDMGIWKDKNFSLLITIFVFGYTGFPILTFWLALYFQKVLGFSALETGVHMLPTVITGLLANAFAALFLHKLSNKLLMGLGAFAYFFSYLLAAVQRHRDSYWAFSFPALCLSVVGVNFHFNVANMYVISSMPSDRQSIAGSLLQTLSRLFTAIGYGIATAIFNGVEKNPAKEGYYAGNLFEPYAAPLWFGAAAAATGIMFVPWLRIGTQGHVDDEKNGDRDRKQGRGIEVLERKEKQIKVEELLALPRFSAFIVTGSWDDEKSRHIIRYREEEYITGY